MRIKKPDYGYLSLLKLKHFQIRKFRLISSLLPFRFPNITHIIKGRKNIPHLIFHLSRKNPHDLFALKKILISHLSWKKKSPFFNLSWKNPTFHLSLKKNKHNAELQRTAPDAQDKEAFSTRGRLFFFPSFTFV